VAKKTKTELLAGLKGTRCIADNKNGTGRCRRWAIKGGSVCWHHGGSAPQVRQAAARRLESAIDRLLAALLHIAEDEDQPAAVRVAAIKDALDRAGFGARDRELTINLRKFEDNIEGIFVDVVSDDIVDAQVVEDEGDPLQLVDRSDLSSPPTPTSARQTRVRRG
jgi:hypothetical protein